jgi:hypothetical protein
MARAFTLLIVVASGGAAHPSARVSGTQEALRRLKLIVVVALAAITVVSVLRIVVKGE